MRRTPAATTTLVPLERKAFGQQTRSLTREPQVITMEMARRPRVVAPPLAASCESHVVSLNNTEQKFSQRNANETGCTQS